MRVPALDLAAFDGVPFPVATRAELRRDRVLAAEGMGHKLVVVWNHGQPRVYEDSCPHLGLPMSMGVLEDDVLRCRYHWWGFDRDTGAVTDQPTLRKQRKCALKRHGCVMVGGLVFAWIGDPDAVDAARAQLPADISEDFALHRVEFGAPFYLALFNAVDYAHFAEHRYYKPLYSLYRRFRRDAHIPGHPFRWEVTGEDDAAVHIRLESARRDLSMYATCADFRDDGGVNRFQTFVTPLGPSRTQYWECYSARTDSPLTRAAAKLLFHTVIVRLLETEDRDWTTMSAPNFLDGRNIHLSETDLPLGQHLRKFVLPRVRAAARASG
ncbi:MAG: Rieske 2Fe-2S domain-containing protein [Proteobacteria bacterium]|nr:Rieske 2Fe-2S domain-containing protein [Pseudomonadota bacterium]